MTMIDVDQLRKVFPDPRRGESVILDDVSFSCQAGEVLGLLGPNGAGKTTTMRILSTVLRPTAGRVRVAGFDVVEQAVDVRQHIGFVSANTALYDRMAAWEHVEYFGKLYGLPDDLLYPRMESIFRELRMEPFRDQLISKLSTGVRQKISIARAIIHDPPVLIFDEPTSGLDVVAAQVVIRQIGRLRDAGKCILYSTHVLREVEVLCRRVAIIHRGAIRAQGALPELNDRYGTAGLEELFFHVVGEVAVAAE